MTDKVTLYLRGDKLGFTNEQPTNNGNPSDPDFSMVAKDVSAMGGKNDIFRLAWHRNGGNADNTDTFSNGQIWRLDRYTGPLGKAADFDNPENWETVFGTIVPKPDLVGGLGMTPEGVVLEVQGGKGGAHLIINDAITFSKDPKDYNIEPPRKENGKLDKGKYPFDSLKGAICFAGGTLIRTEFGETRVEDLQLGDLVRTVDNGLKPVLWIGKREIDQIDFMFDEKLRPVRIQAGALGNKTPEEDLVVSPQHRVLVRSGMAIREFGAEEILIPAVKLVGMPGIEVASEVTEVSYFHIMFDDHEIILANGAEAESLFTGPMALKSMSKEARGEIQKIFPELVEGYQPMTAARPMIDGRQARRVVSFHIDKDRPLVRKKKKDFSNEFEAVAMRPAY